MADAGSSNPANFTLLSIEYLVIGIAIWFPILLILCIFSYHLDSIKSLIVNPNIFNFILLIFCKYSVNPFMPAKIMSEGNMII